MIGNGFRLERHFAQGVCRRELDSGIFVAQSAEAGRPPESNGGEARFRVWRRKPELVSVLAESTDAERQRTAWRILASVGDPAPPRAMKGSRYETSRPCPRRAGSHPDPQGHQ